MAAQNRNPQTHPSTNPTSPAPQRQVTNEPQIVITRLIGAPRELVFKAWTEPEHLIEWWGPRGFTVPHCEMDVRPGGAYRIEMRSPEGVVYPLKGVYRTVVEPVRLVMSQNWEENPAEWHELLRQSGMELSQEAVLTATFEEHDGKTKLTILTRFGSMGDRDAMQRQGMIEGWTESLLRLEQHLANA